MTQNRNGWLKSEWMVQTTKSVRFARRKIQSKHLKHTSWRRELQAFYSCKSEGMDDSNQNGWFKSGWAVQISTGDSIQSERPLSQFSAIIVVQEGRFRQSTSSKNWSPGSWEQNVIIFSCKENANNNKKMNKKWKAVLMMGFAATDFLH